MGSFWREGKVNLQKDIIWLFLQPTDVVLFRDGRPFTAETTFARSIFPPLPSTFAGAIRSYLGAEVLCSFSDLGDAESSPLQFLGPFLAKLDVSEIYFPAPKNVFLPRKGEPGKPVLAYPIPDNSWIFPLLTNLPDWTSNLSWLHSPQHLEPASGYVSLSAFAQWLNGNISSWNEQTLLKSSHFLEKESRFHIRVEPKRWTVWEEIGGLFSVDFIRLKEAFGFLLGLQKGKAPENLWEKVKEHFLKTEKGILFLGGERKMAYWWKVPSPPESFLLLFHPPQDLSPLSLYFFTPVVLPDPANPLKLFPDGTRILSVFCSSSIPVGGWDYKRNKPKPLKTALPAGSVFYLDKLPPDSHFLGEMISLGFGMCISGRIGGAS